MIFEEFTKKISRMYADYYLSKPRNINDFILFLKNNNIYSEYNLNLLKNFYNNYYSLVIRDDYKKADYELYKMYNQIYRNEKLKYLTDEK